MIIQGTSKLQKRTLNLNSVSIQLVSGQSLPIDDNDFWNQDVQIAVKAGWVEVIEGPSGNSEDRENVVKCMNSYHKPIFIPQIKQEVSPDRS